MQPQTRNNGAIAQLVEQRTENPCVPGSIPGGTTFTKRKIMKIAEITVFQRFFLYVLSAKICNLGFSRFFVGIIFYLREVLLTLHYEKRLFEHASQPRVACQILDYFLISGVEQTSQEIHIGLDEK